MKPDVYGMPLFEETRCMAVLTPDDLFYGTRGRVGDIVLRWVGGRTVMSRRPKKPDPSKQSVKQKRTRSNFWRATEWAREILADPVQKVRYAELAKEWGLTNARIAAIKDFMRTIRGDQEGKDERVIGPERQLVVVEVTSRRCNEGRRFLWKSGAERNAYGMRMPVQSCGRQGNRRDVGERVLRRKRSCYHRKGYWRAILRLAG